MKPVTSEQYLKDPDNLPLDKEGGVIIIPDKGFVFKTKDRQGGKVFINITHHPLIDKLEQKEIVDMDVCGYLFVFLVVFVLFLV